MNIDAFPVWVLFFVTVAMVLVAVEIGYRSGRKVRGQSDQELESPVAAIVAAMLGLQAFLLAFAFGIASDRYDSKKALVREEVNVIRTAWSRSDFLQEPDRSTSKALLREYVGKRIVMAEAREVGAINAALADARSAQRRLWDMAVSNARSDMNSYIGAQYVEAIGEVAAVHSKRMNLGEQARVPNVIWAVLYSLLVLGMFGLGYQTAISGSRRSRTVPVLAVSFSLVFALVAALDNPTGPFITVSQVPMLNLQGELGSASEPSSTGP